MKVISTFPDYNSIFVCISNSDILISVELLERIGQILINLLNKNTRNLLVCVYIPIE